MQIVSENEHTTASIKAELDQLFAAASYFNADGGEIGLVINLIAAAIVELDNVTAEKTPPNIRLVQTTESEKSA